MAFTTAVLANVAGLQVGEILASSPYNVEAFDTFQEGITAGRFVKYDTGSIDLLDTSATPTIAGVVKRKVDQATEQADVYTLLGTTPDTVAEVIDFGYAVVEVQAAAAPVKYNPVYTINLATAESGKATQDSLASGALLVPDCIFWQQVSSTSWLVRMTAYRA